MPNEPKNPKGTKYYKVHMSEEAYHVLSLEAALKHESLKDAVSRLVLAGVSSKTIAAMKAAGEQSTDKNKGTKEQIPEALKEKVLNGTKEQSLNGPKGPLDLSPQSLDLLSANERVALAYLQAGVPYRKIEELEKGKTNITKAIVSGMAQKFKGMGIFQGNKRGPKKQKVK